MNIEGQLVTCDPHTTACFPSCLGRSEGLGGLPDVLELGPTALRCLSCSETPQMEQEDLALPHLEGTLCCRPGVLR